jgi:hypothetical protein
MGAIILAPLVATQSSQAEARVPAPALLKTTIHLGAPQVVRVGEFDRVTLTGTANLERPGEPRLPFYVARLLLPPGTTAADLSVVGEPLDLPGGYLVEPAQAPVRANQEAGPPTEPSDAVYALGAPYPGVLHASLDVQVKRGYAMAIVTLYPVQYTPAEERLTYYESLNVRIDLRPAPLSPMLRAGAQDRDRAEVERLVSNPAVLEGYAEALASSGEGRGGSEALDPSQSYDYLIVTNQALASAPGPHNLQAFAADKEAQGLRTTIVTTEWIAANYGGGDLQTRIRNHIADAYATWGVDYVLLAGDADGASIGGETGPAIVPVRGLYGRVPSTGGDTVEQNIASDLYYACLDGPYDNNGNGLYGEPTDGLASGDVDLLPEVYVGRAPVDNASELANFVRKTLAYQAEANAYLRSVLLVGEKLGDDWPAPWGGDRKDDTRYGATGGGMTTVGFENSPYAAFYETRTLYDRDYPGHIWPVSEVISAINSPVHIVNSAGHANIDYLMRLTRDLVDTQLTNDRYFIGYDQACYAGSFDNRRLPELGGGYDPIDSIVEHLTVRDHGAVAYIANSRYGWNNASDPHTGPSQFFDRLFWDAVLGEGLATIGRAHADAKQDGYALLGPAGMTGAFRWAYYELNLLGDPALRIKTSQQTTQRLQGQVSSLRSGLPASGASVQVLSGGHQVAAGLSGPDGGYALSIPPGEFQVRVSHAAYVDDLAGLTVGAGAQVTHDVALMPRSPWVAPSPAALELIMRPGEQRQGQITVRNNGPDPLVFAIEVDPAADWLTVSPMGGTVGAYGAQPLSLTTDATQISHYEWRETDVVLTSNDPELPILYLPVRMGALQLIQLPLVNG